VDPLTQGTLGAAAALLLAPARCPLPWVPRALVGALGGVTADLDVLISSANDPLLAIEFHRHFTHSLAFIPLGGVLTGLPLLAWRKLRQHTPWVLLLSTLGYASHALLDACTTYGTLLLWPLSQLRVSWHVVSIIDPLFTLPLLAAVITAVKRRSALVIRAGMLFALLYLGLGLVQRERASAVQTALAKQRDHHVERAVVLPSFANNLTWRSLYQAQGQLYVDKIRVGWLGGVCASAGAAVPVVPAPAFDALHPVVARGERLLRWFASDWVAPDPSEPSVLGDLRYSFAPREVTPIWGIRRLPLHLPPEQQTDVQWVNKSAQRRVTWADFRELLVQDNDCVALD
jgi:inner membrane protein